MTFATAIQTYDGAHASHSVGDANCAVDWANAQLWMGGAVSTVGYLSRYGIVGGAEQAFHTTADIGGGVAAPAVGWDTDGHIYARGPVTLDYGSITRMDGATFAFKSNSYYADPNFGGANIVSLKVGSSQYVLDNNFGNDVINLNNTSLSVDGTYIGSFGWGGGARGFICMGLPATGRGYLLTSPGGGSDPQQTNLQRIDLAHAAATTIGTFVPADFDAGWTEAYARGLCLDQTDGNLIACVSGVGNSNYNYLIKLDVTTGAIVWKRLLTTTGPEGIGGQHMSQARILNQRLAIVQATPVQTITVVNTNDGSVVSTQTTGLAGLSFQGQQAFDSVSGSIILMVTMTAAAGGPTLLNSSTAPFTGWARLDVVAPTAAPGPNGPATSRKRAWTFTLDGHTFYALDLGAEGTWIYDKTTQTWVNFYTLAYTQWNVTCGVMWGNRIVGGDLVTSDVYEVAASNLQDNGDVDISHCVTGGLAVRSRDGFSLDALLLTVSAGELDDPAATINMRFSDDNGETWSDYFPMSMTAGAYEDELRWLSLGNFSSPGRIFEFSDAGGPLSIGGCDAFLDGFDKDDAQQE